MSTFGTEPVDPIDAYDSKHGKPAPDAPVISEDDAWGNKLNPVRETPLAGSNLKAVGK
jgi:hypothetical protein